MTLVVDASVVAMWLLPEDHSAAALRILDSGLRLTAPDLVFAEVANTLWKRVRRGELGEDEALAAARALGVAPLETSPTLPLLQPALEIALSTRRTVYDCLYVALALREQSRLVTGDRVLFNALAGGPYASRLLWVEEDPS